MTSLFSVAVASALAVLEVLDGLEARVRAAIEAAVHVQADHAVVLEALQVLWACPCNQVAWEGLLQAKN